MLRLNARQDRGKLACSRWYLPRAAGSSPAGQSGLVAELADAQG